MTTEKRSKPSPIRPEDVRIIEQDPRTARPILIFGEAARKLADRKRKREREGKDKGKGG